MYFLFRTNRQKMDHWCEGVLFANLQLHNHSNILVDKVNSQEYHEKFQRKLHMGHF